MKILIVLFLFFSINLNANLTEEDINAAENVGMYVYHGCPQEESPNADDCFRTGTLLYRFLRFIEII